MTTPIVATHTTVPSSRPTWTYLPSSCRTGTVSPVYVEKLCSEGDSGHDRLPSRVIRCVDTDATTPSASGTRGLPSRANAARPWEHPPASSASSTAAAVARGVIPLRCSVTEAQRPEQVLHQPGAHPPGQGGARAGRP